MDKYQIGNILLAIDRVCILECYAKRKIDTGYGTVPVESTFRDKTINPIMQDCMALADQLDLSASLARMRGKIVPFLEQGILSVDALNIQMQELRHDLEREIESHVFIHIPRDKVEKVLEWNPDWFHVIKAFPNTKTDIIEASDCFALAKNTASVFHMMRVAEWGLRALCVDVGFKRIKSKIKATGEVQFTPIEYATWETMINQVRRRVDEKVGKLRRGSAKQKLQELYIPLTQELDGFKEAWRNHVMHTRKEYLADDVKAIVSHVSRFMKKMAENGITNV